MEERSVADVAGPWGDSTSESSLLQRCRDNWTTPVSELSNHVLATFVRQAVALELVVPEAQRRVEMNYLDGTELYDEEQAAALASFLSLAHNSNGPRNGG